MSRLRLADFDYDLPRELIAQVPATERTGSRLLHVDGAKLADLSFIDLPRLIAAGDLLVFNDTRVIKSRLIAVKPTGGRVELLLERLHGPHEALFQVRASHAPKLGEPHPATRRTPKPWSSTATIDSSLCVSRAKHRGSTISTATARSRFRRTSNERRSRRTRRATRRSTRGMPARSPHRPRGCISTQALLSALAAAGAAFAYVTLHVGAGTFAPVTLEDIAKHTMHPEWYRVPMETAAAIAATRARQGRVLAIGTTTVRALESAADDERRGLRR